MKKAILIYEISLVNYHLYPFSDSINFLEIFKTKGFYTHSIPLNNKIIKKMVNLI
jgi:hypothetical protein